MAPAPVAPQVIAQPSDLSSRDWAVFLLHSAAQVEHALMVQYLFAAYSLRLGEPVADGVFTDDWNAQFLDIAREEMGHLLTVQNLLRLVGGPLCFEREDFPVRSMFYPFRFVLERVSKGSIAKYVFAEMSPGPIPETILTAAEREEITASAKKAAGAGDDGFVNHVGTLYQTLRDVFAALAADQLVDAPEWQSLGWTGTNDDPDTTFGVELLPARNLEEALAAIDAIAQQGAASSTAPSHFTRFVAMYRQYPADEAAARRLALPIARNPSTRSDDPDATLIEDESTALWAELLNVRYRMLLMALQHSTLADPAALAPGGQRIRDVLKGWTYEEMVQGAGSVSNLAVERLVQAPVTTGGSEMAGLPFSLPYTMSLPDRDADRWRLHIDLLDGAQGLVDALRDRHPDDELLPLVADRDRARRAAIAAITAG